MRTPLSNQKTPAELLDNSKSILDKITLFECRAYSFVPKKSRLSKLESHLEKFITQIMDTDYKMRSNEKNYTMHNMLFMIKVRTQSKQKFMTY